jgi:hypothetical protein
VSQFIEAGHHDPTLATPSQRSGSNSKASFVGSVLFDPAETVHCRNGSGPASSIIILPRRAGAESRQDHTHTEIVHVGIQLRADSVCLKWHQRREQQPWTPLIWIIGLPSSRTGVESLALKIGSVCLMRGRK